MDAHEIWECILDPEKRAFKKITIADVQAAENALSVCMGSDVSARRQFIEDNAYKVTVQN